MIMTKSAEISANNNKSVNVLDLAEIISVVGAVVGTGAAIALKELIFVSVPLSASVVLNLVNRKRLQTVDLNETKTVISQLLDQETKIQTNLNNTVEQSKENKITVAKLNQQSRQQAEQLESITEQLGQQSQDNQGNFANLTEKIQEIEVVTINRLMEKITEYNEQTQGNIQSLAQQLADLKTETQAHFNQQNKNHEAQIQALTDQLKELQQLTANLSKAIKKIQEHGQSLTNKHKALAEVVDCLREIENRSHSIEHQANLDQSYYERALYHESLGDFEVAIADYSEAIRLNPRNAKAYYNRGVLRSKVGVRQEAVDDLRIATKLFFDQGDLTTYQEVRRLQQQLHELDAPDINANVPQLVVEGLFS
jgi:tetratricopeptide (TPR) repeat protein